MASISTNFPRTYYKLAETWSKKTGNRIYKDNIFLKAPPNDPILNVPYVVGNAFNRVDDLVGALKTLLPAAQTTGPTSLWIYDMRITDAMPRTTADTERLYAFVRKLISSGWFVDTETGRYLETHIHITVAFFVWWFTTENFYFATNEIRQTTYHGIRRVWRTVLLAKEPIVAEAVTPVKRVAQRSTGVKHSAVVSAKEVSKCRELQGRIIALVREEHPAFDVHWNDDREVHLKISECFEESNKHYITGKKSKKLQKMYQDYCKVKKKGAVSKALANSAEEPRAAVAEMPHTGAAEEEQDRCTGCLTNQPNQLAHIGLGGCLGDDSEEDDDVPDSWEDL